MARWPRHPHLGGVQRSAGQPEAARLAGDAGSGEQRPGGLATWAEGSSGPDQIFGGYQKMTVKLPCKTGDSPAFPCLLEQLRMQSCISRPGAHCHCGPLIDKRRSNNLSCEDPFCGSEGESRIGVDWILLKGKKNHENMSQKALRILPLFEQKDWDPWFSCTSIQVANVGRP